MGKKRRRIGDAELVTSGFGIPNKCVECQIDKLPDELLVSILSCLTLKEAAKTCVLSRSWRYLWQYSSGSLEFYDWDRNTYEPEVAAKFIRMVNKVSKLHQAPYLHQFKVGFTFYVGCSEEMDRWIEFAIEKEVKLLELNLSAGRTYAGGPYVFPDIGKLLAASGKLKLSRVCYNLKSLRLVSVNVKEEVIHYFLSNCPLLEELCVSGSYCLENLKFSGSLPSLKSMEISYCNKVRSLEISGPLPNLKSMEISYCYKVKSVDIDASNIVSFTYIGPDIVVPFQNPPPELTIGDDYCYSFIFNIDKHTHYLSNLRKLKLDVSLEVMSEMMGTFSYPDHFHNFPRLNNLRELEFDVVAQAGESLLFFNIFTKASPLLSSFTARIRYYSVLRKKLVKFARKNECEARLATRFSHKCLKVVKIIGFTGRRSDYKLALHLLEIGPFIKEIILQPVTDNHNPKIKDETLIRKRSKQLEAKLPPGAKLVII